VHETHSSTYGGRPCPLGGARDASPRPKMSSYCAIESVPHPFLGVVAHFYDGDPVYRWYVFFSSLYSPEKYSLILFVIDSQLQPNISFIYFQFHPLISI
jgi:hypothetical protein